MHAKSTDRRTARRGLDRHGLRRRLATVLRASKRRHLDREGAPADVAEGGTEGPVDGSAGYRVRRTGRQPRQGLPARPGRQGRGHPQSLRLRDRQGAVELRLRRARHVSSSQARARRPRWTATSSTSLVRSATCTRSTSTRTSRCGARTSGRTSGAATRSSLFRAACGAECRGRRLGLRRGAPPALATGRTGGSAAGAGRPSCSAPGRAGRNASGGTRRAARWFGFALWS